jgi:dihydrofolate reductase
MEESMTVKTEISVIFAADDDYGIGKDNALPWPVNAEDMAWFKKHTRGHCVIMGRKTWESLGRKPLPNRENVVLTSNPREIDGYPNFNEPEKYPDYAANMPLHQIINQVSPYFDKVFIIGGKSLIEKSYDLVDKMYITRMKGNFDCDVKVTPPTLVGFKSEHWETSQDGKATFNIWARQK